MKVRRGMSLLEVVIAIVMLSSLSAVVLGSISFMERAARRDHRKLEAMEVAHRIVAQALAHFDELPSDTLPIQHGANLYYYRLYPEVLVITDSESGSSSIDTIRTAEADIQAQIRNKLHQIVVHIFPADTQGRIQSTDPLVTVTRVFNIMKGDDQEVVARILKMVEQEQRRGRR